MIFEITARGSLSRYRHFDVVVAQPDRYYSRSIKLGYGIGGRLADRKPEPRLLSAVIFAARRLISVTVLNKRDLLSSIVQRAMSSS